MKTEPALLFVVLLAACGGRAASPAAQASPAWCRAALAELDRSGRSVPPHDTTPAEIAALETLAYRMDEEGEALAKLGEDDALAHASDAAGGVSAASSALVSRRRGNRDDAPSAERALAITLRERERALLVVRAQCGAATAPVEQSPDWTKRANEVVAARSSAMRACISADARGELPARTPILVHVGAGGRATFATPVETSFDLGKWGPSDLAHCLVRVLEATTFPPPEGTATLLVPFDRDGKRGTKAQ